MNIIFLIFELCICEDNVFQLLNLDLHAPQQLQASQALPLLRGNELNTIRDNLLFRPRVLLHPTRNKIFLRWGGGTVVTLHLKRGMPDSQQNFLNLYLIHNIKDNPCFSSAQNSENLKVTCEEIPQLKIKNILSILNQKRLSGLPS